jgi:flagellar biosynthesis repressor protein FlbT
MSKTMQISLRAGERIYINGAVVRADRKVSLELMNDVVFLLEAHVLQADETTTPLRQLYFVLQAILMDPQNAAATLILFRDVLASTTASFSNEAVLAKLSLVQQLVGANRIFEALRTIRGLFPIERAILDGVAAQPPRAA